MSKIISSDKNVEFIIYNHLFSQNTYEFTLNELVTDLKKYHLELSEDLIQEEIDTFVESGLIERKFRRYAIAGR